MRRTTILKSQNLLQIGLQRKVIHMIRFIEQEGTEKAEEIDCKTEEEFNILKGNFLQAERIIINKEYDLKEEQCIRQTQIDNGKSMHAARMTEINSKLKFYEMIEADVREQIVKDLACGKRRWKVIQRLLMEGLFKLLEKKVIIKCREIDANMLRKTVSEIQFEYKRATNKDITLEVDETYLPNDVLPGIVLKTSNNKISMVNTLDDRLKQIMRSSLPVMNQLFFGTKKMRR